MSNPFCHFLFANRLKICLKLGILTKNKTVNMVVLVGKCLMRFPLTSFSFVLVSNSRFWYCCKCLQDKIKRQMFSCWSLGHSIFKSIIPTKVKCRMDKNRISFSDFYWYTIILINCNLVFNGCFIIFQRRKHHQSIDPVIDSARWLMGYLDEIITCIIVFEFTYFKVSVAPCSPTRRWKFELKGFFKVQDK